jgi:hypothetical protein
MQLGWNNEGGEFGIHGSRRVGDLRDIIRYQGLESLWSKTISSKLVFDLDLKRVCSNNASNPRSSILCMLSLGKDRLMSR